MDPMMFLTLTPIVGAIAVGIFSLAMLMVCFVAFLAGFAIGSHVERMSW